MTTNDRQAAEDLVASVSRAKWTILLRVYSTRGVAPADLEDCLAQATLELVVQARRGTIPADPRLVAGALEHKFASRIIDRRRAMTGRSASASYRAIGTAVEDLADLLPGQQDTAEQALGRDELRRLASALPRLTDDQRLVIRHRASGDGTPGEFAARHGWSMEKYRKVSQRARARLKALLEDDAE
jgi:DNA-directed RNA polymerase specialized sigma24 family protein